MKLKKKREVTLAAAKSREKKRAPTWCPVCGRKHSKDDACEPRRSSR